MQTPKSALCIGLMQSVCIMKLSYRKQIARQLHTQYVEGIYSNSETFIKLIGH